MNVHHPSGLMTQLREACQQARFGDLCPGPGTLAGATPTHARPCEHTTTSGAHA